MAEHESLFTGFGLFWDRTIWLEENDLLLGWKPRSPYWVKPPEKPQFILNDQTAIYVLHAPNREIVYVGQVGSKKVRLGERLMQHARQERRDRWSHFSWFSLAPLSADTDENRRRAKTKSHKYEGRPAESIVGIPGMLNEVEAILLTLIEPQLNKQGGRWKYVPKIEQWHRDEHISLADVYEEVHKLRAELGK